MMKKVTFKPTIALFEQEAFFKGAEEAWRKYLTGKFSTVRLPKANYKGKLYGTIYIQFVVTADGKVTDVKTLNSITLNWTKLPQT